MRVPTTRIPTAEIMDFFGFAERSVDSRPAPLPHWGNGGLLAAFLE
jgi:hypothetical protein